MSLSSYFRFFSDLRTEEDNSYKNRVIHSVHSNVQHKAYSNSVPETILRNVSKDHLTTEPPLLENSDGINHGENESVAIPQFVDISSRRNNERESEATGKKVEEAVYQVQVPDRYTALEGPLTVTIMKGSVLTSSFRSMIQRNMYNAIFLIQQTQNIILFILYAYVKVYYIIC